MIFTRWNTPTAITTPMIEISDRNSSALICGGRAKTMSRTPHSARAVFCFAILGWAKMGILD